MNPCPEYQNELAACAATQQLPAGSLARHLGACANCRTAFSELQEVAKLHSANARELPRPTRRARPNFSVLSRRPRSARFYRPALVLAEGMLAAFLVFGFWRRGEPTPPQQPKTAFATSPEIAVPTWQALRQEMQSGNLTLAAAEVRAASTPSYRVKDAYVADN
jgi:hypothetical protein